MFKSWGVTVLDGMAGVTLNMLTFYAVRLLMPSIGLVLLAIVGAESGNVGLAVVFLVLAVAIIAVLLLVLAQERWAVLLGRLGAQVAQRLRREADPDQWSRTVVDFRKRVSAGLPAKLARSLTALTLMVVADATILTLALRFTGVGGTSCPCCSSSARSAPPTRSRSCRCSASASSTRPCSRRSPRWPGSRRRRRSWRRWPSGGP